MEEEKTTSETQKPDSRPDRSQLNAFENFYEKHRNLIIQKEDIQSMSVKNDTLLIFYRKENNKATSVVKQVELKSDMLSDEVLEFIFQ